MTKTLTSLKLGTALTAIAAFTNPAFAQDVPITAITEEDLEQADSGSAAQNVTVTARRTEESLQRVPASVSAFNERALERIRALELEPVLGDGSGTDISNWCEACVARTTIRNAGELNGFLKLRRPLLARPPEVRRGTLHLSVGGLPPVDRAWLDEITGERLLIERPAFRQVA